MPYTSWGYMTHDEIREVEADMDLGSYDIQMDDPPEWLEKSYPTKSCDETHPEMDQLCHGGHPATCPACGKSLWGHESVTVVRASGEIFRCVDAEGQTHEVPEPPIGVMYE